MPCVAYINDNVCATRGVGQALPLRRKERTGPVQGRTTHGRVTLRPKPKSESYRGAEYP
jgi:hypothetical protein